MNKHLEALIDYCWKDELRDFEETFETTFGSNDTLEEWIEWIDLQSNPNKELMQNHIFYHLMKLKQLCGK